MNTKVPPQCLTEEVKHLFFKMELDLSSLHIMSDQMAARQGRRFYSDFCLLKEYSDIWKNTHSFSFFWLSIKTGQEATASPVSPTFKTSLVTFL